MITFREISLFTAILGGALFLTSCQGPGGSSVITPLSLGPGVATEERVFFLTDIKYIFEGRCVMCHNRRTLPGKWHVKNRYQAVRKPYIIPGDPENSLLLTYLKSGQLHEKAMPPVGVQVSPEEIDTLERWILQGAPWPGGPTGNLQITTIPAE